MWSCQYLLVFVLDVIEKVLKKKELRAQVEKSAIARAALAQWNKLNTAVRRQVYSTKVRMILFRLGVYS